MVKPWPHRASTQVPVSALMLGKYLILDMMLTLDVGCTGVNQCGSLDALTLMLTLGVAKSLE